MLGLQPSLLCSASVPGWLAFLVYSRSLFPSQSERITQTADRMGMGTPGITGTRDMGLHEGH